MHTVRWLACLVFIHLSGQYLESTYYVAGIVNLRTLTIYEQGTMSAFKVLIFQRKTGCKKKKMKRNPTLKKKKNTLKR